MQPGTNQDWIGPDSIGPFTDDGKEVVYDNPPEDLFGEPVEVDLANVTLTMGVE